MEWQPIETAPKDGTQVLLWCPDFKNPLKVGEYIESEMYRNGDLVSERKYWSIGSMIFDDPQPTYWMTLPSPPLDVNQS